MEVAVTLKVDIDDYWIEYLTRDSDVFHPHTCGYWMYGVERDRDLGWLCFEHDERLRLRDVEKLPEYPQIVEAWKAGKELPPGWFRLDQQAAIQAWMEGVKRWGEKWYNDVDCSKEDVVIQMALLREVKYG